jgi:hypothetical protein
MALTAMLGETADQVVQIWTVAANELNKQSRTRKDAILQPEVWSGTKNSSIQRVMKCYSQGLSNIRWR